MVKLYQNSVLAGIILIIGASLLNRGGGPLVSHLILTMIVFAIAFFGFLLRKKFKPQPFNILEIILLLFLVFFLLSFTVSLTKNFGLNEFLLFTNSIILILLIQRINFPQIHIERFKTILVFLAFLETIAGIIIYTAFAFPRFGGTFIDLKAPHTSFANDFANFSILLLPLCFEKFFKSRKVNEKILFGLISAFVFSGFLLSFSRGAWLSFFVALIFWGVWLVYHYKKNIFSKIRYFIPHAVVLLFVAVSLIFILQSLRAQNFQINSFLGKATFQADEGGSSVKERLDFWKGAIQIIKERPWLGSGILSFKFLYPKYQPNFGANWDHPHNIFLKIGVENGLPAAILFLVFLIIFAFKFLKNSSKFPALVPLMIGALGAFGHNLIDYNFIVSNFTLFAVFLGLGLMSLRGAERQSSPTETKNSFTDTFSLSSRWIFHFCVLTSTVLLFIGLHEGYYNYFFKEGRALLNDYPHTSQSYLEKAQKLFWKRDISAYLAFAHRRQGKKTEEEALLKRNAENETINASIWNRLGEILFEKGDKKTAAQYFKRALELDPKNRFKYYYNYFTAAADTDFQAVKNLLSEYKSILRRNAHFTILTDNPAYAIKLYELIGTQEAREKAGILRQIYIEETVKYIAKYGPLPPESPL